MFDEIQKILEKLNANHREYRTWQKVVSVLACITVFCTTYALILPAITLESSPDVICGMEEHTHTSDCYERTPVLICQNEDPDHVHTDECYQVDSVIICGKEEHKHSETCFPKEEEADTADAPTTEPTEGTDGDESSETGQPETAAPVTGETGETKETEETEETKAAEETKASEQTENDEESTEAEEADTEEQPEQRVPAARSMLRAAALKNVKKTRSIDVDGVETEKNISDPDANGVYTITMEAYATGEQSITIVEKTAPTDIILVLDQSGSMSNKIKVPGYGTQVYGEAPFTVKSNDQFYQKRSSYGGIYLKQSDDTYVKINVSRTKSGQKYTYTYKRSDNNAVILTSSGATTAPNFVSAGYASNSAYFYTLIDGSVSRQEILKEAVSKFVEKVAENATEDDAAHRIAMVGFADGKTADYYQKSSYYNTEILINGTPYGYGSAAQSVYSSAFMETNTATGVEKLENSIGTLDAAGATNTDLGLEMACGIFQANPVTNRNRVVIMFTDGVPGKSDNWNNVSDTVTNNALNYAQKLKDEYKASVYTVGIFDGADPQSLGSASGNDTVKRANNFMQRVSSNNGTVKDPSYYLVPSDASDLMTIFQSIAQQVSTGGATNVSLSSSTTVMDIVSDFFDLPEGADTSSVRVYAVPCTGEDAGGERTFKDSEAGFNMENYRYNDATVTVSGKKISVSGFDFSANWCGNVTNGSTVTPHGSKLVIKIPVVPEDDFVGGYDVPSNATGSGIYVDGKLVEDFPDPTVDVEKDMDVLLPDTLFGANNKTIYAKGTTLTANDLFNGLDKVRTLKAFVESSHAQTETNTEYTFDIPDDDAIKNDASGSYTVKVEVKQKSTGEVKKTKSVTARVYVLVPQIQWRDNRVLCGEIYTKQDCLDHNFVSVGWVADNGWKYTTDGGNAPAATGSQGTLDHTFVDNGGTPYSNEHPIVVNTDTPVNVWVSARYGDGNAVNITDSALFTYEACSDPLHTQTSIHSHKGSEGSPEFYLHADSGAVLPSTGGSGTKNWLIVGLTFMALPIMIGLSIQRRRDMILVV